VMMDKFEDLLVSLTQHRIGQFRVSESANLDIYGLLRVRRIVPSSFVRATSHLSLIKRLHQT
jgi:hypothetical protein